MTPPTVVHVPERPSGPVLAALIREVRAASATGAVVIDASAAAGWPPGPRLVLERLEAVARRRGTGRPSGTS
ncbi:hypothetical protein WDV85_12910 [Pseudokineococcus sp. 5B2Z-1]